MNNKVEENADGIWYYMPQTDKLKFVEFDNYDGDPNKTFIAAPYHSKWTGTFTGESKDYGLGVAHGQNPMIFVVAVAFESVEVDGATGGLQMDALGERPAVGSDWRGTWVITGGSGELQELRGHGTFWGPGWLGNPDDYGVIYYQAEELEFAAAGD